MIPIRTRPARLYTLLAAISAVALGGCGAKDGGTVEVAVIGEGPLELGDPARVPRSEVEAVLRQNMAQGLVRIDPSGQIEPGLAERWNVSDDGLSYIFRLAAGTWPDGRKIVARDVARMLDRQVRSGKDDPTRDALGAVDEVVAMTDRVIELRLRAPRPNLLPLLAQPELALIREGVGTGPFHLRPAKEGERPLDPPRLRLEKRIPGFDGAEDSRERVTIKSMPAAEAIAAFVRQDVDLVLGGTIADLPVVQRVKLRRGSLRFDPAYGLFGLVPRRKGGLVENEELRSILSQAIDRDALVAALKVPGLVGRTTILQRGLYGLGEPPAPSWASQPVAERRPALAQAVRALRSPDDRDTDDRRSGDRDTNEAAAVELPTIAIDLPDAPGGDIILARLRADWGMLGYKVVRAGDGVPADFAVIDAVAPSDSPAWYLRHFRCELVPICLPDADVLLQTARDAPDPAQRAALFGEAARLMDDAQLFIPLAAPIRWSLASDRAQGFVENRYARHALGGLADKPSRGSQQ